MAGGGSSTPVSLPVVSFTKVEDDFSNNRLAVPEQPTRSYGYNDGSNFQRPEHYIRYIEPLESELAVQVEYDMDEQDQHWLDSLNNERKAKDLGSVPYEVFEIVMDRLEKEWFDLTKNIPKPDLVMPSEDSTCAICDDSEGENTNAIVFCDGCNLAVHQDCYGVPYIPEGQWLCRKCTVSPENPVSCILCPNEGGAFKQTVQGEWVHLLCAIWVPETRVANDVFMEPVTGVDRISKQRWKLKCSICDIREGACIQCTKASCFLAFHATCARKEKLLMPMKSSQGSEAPTLACYCEKHLPREQAEARAVALAAEQSDVTHDDQQLSKTARAYAKTYKPGPPLVPQIIVKRIEQYISRLHLRHKHEFIVLVCKYWSLKREARRGAPLLKRLHLEPWTASAGGRNQSDDEKAIKLEYMKRVRNDLEALRVLAVACRRRESRKLEQQHTIQKVFSHMLLVRQPSLRMAFETIMAQDKSGYFKDPVSKTEVPDYYDIIKNPICWSTIDEKLDRYEYWDVQALKDDIHLILTNAMVYNKADTAYWRAAQRIRNASEPVFADLDKRMQAHTELAGLANGNSSTNGVAETEHTTSSQPHPLPLIGDVEPPLELLELLTSQDTIQNDKNMKFMLDKLPVEALFSYELRELKPVSPPPTPPPPPEPKQKRKRDRKAEKERRRLSQAAALESATGFQLPRTRRALAAVAAFEAEASGQGDQVEQADGLTTETGEEAVTAEAGSGGTDVVEEEAVHGIEGPPDAEVANKAVAAVPTKRKNKHKRAPIMLPGQSEVPPVVEHVDNQQSFKMFDGGWILPNDHRRGGRAPLERQPLPEPKRKRARTGDREKSHLSTVTVPENEPSQNSSLPEEPGLSMSSPHDSSMDAQMVELALTEANEVDEMISTAQPVSEDVPLEASSTVPDNAEVDEGPPRIIIIEELDTPATRREKNIRKKAERQRLRAEAEARAAEELRIALERDKEHAMDVDVEQGSQSELTSLGSTNGDHEGDHASMDGDPEDDVLSGSLTPVEALTSEGDEEGLREDMSSHPSAKEESSLSLPPTEASPSTRPTTRNKSRQKSEAEWGKLHLAKGQFLEGGTLVWAKLPSYPWWPAVVFEADDPTADREVVQARTSQEIKKHRLHLVRFYDNKDYWNWMEPDNLKMLGDDADLDAEMLATSSSLQRWKNARTREQLRRSYRRAMAEMEA